MKKKKRYIVSVIIKGASGRCTFVAVVNVVLSLTEARSYLPLRRALFFSSMAKDPAFLLYSQDFIVGVQTLNMEDRGKYITLLCQMHQQGRLNEETICFLVGSVSVSLRNKFLIDENGFWYNKRLETETKKRNTFTESRRNNGKKGGRPKKKQRKNKDTSQKPYGYPLVNHMGNEDVNENDNVNNIKKECELIFPFTSARFRDVWKMWNEYRVQIRKPYRSVMSEQAALKKLASYPESDAIQMIETSIANQWQGIFEINKQTSNGTTTRKEQHAASTIDFIAKHYGHKPS